MNAMESIHEFAKGKAGNLIAVCILAFTVGGYALQVGKAQGRIEDNARRISLLEEQNRQFATKSELSDQYKDMTRRLDRIEDKVDNIARENGLTVRAR